MGAFRTLPGGKVWKFSEHVCKDDGILALDDSAIAKAFDRRNLMGLHTSII